MADLQTLERALRNADAAGDVEAAQAFAAEIVRMRSDLPPLEPPPGAVVHGVDGTSTLYGEGGKPVANMGGRVQNVETPEAARASAIQGEILKMRGEKAMPEAGRALMPLYQGQTFGWGDEAVSGLRGAEAWMRGKSYNDAYDLTQEYQRQQLGQERKDNPGRALGLEMAGNVLSSAAALPAIPEALGGQILYGVGTGAGLGGIQGAGAATDTDPMASRVDAGLQGAAFGGAVGGVAPVAIAGIKRLITPFGTPPAKQAAVDALGREGVDVSAGQKTGSKPLKWIESVSGDAIGSGDVAANFAAKQGEQFTSAALKRMGVDAPRATPDVVGAAVKRIGNDFETLSARNTLTFDPFFATEVRNVVSKYAKKLPSQQKEVFYNYLQDIAQYGGGLPGEVYQVARSDLSRHARSIKASDPQLSTALRGLRDALDNAMNRSISPSDRGAWKTARRQWANWKVLEKPITAAGENAAEGLISPSALRNSVAVADRSKYAQGAGDLAELARAGESVLKPLPNSGTSPRETAMRVLSSPYSIAAAAGAGGYASGGDTKGSLVGALAGGLAPGLAGRVVWSRAMQKYLGNQLANRALDPEVRRALQALVSAPARTLAVDYRRGT